MSDLFTIPEHPYNLINSHNLYSLNKRTAKFGIEAIVYSGCGLLHGAASFAGRLHLLMESFIKC